VDKEEEWRRSRKSRSRTSRGRSRSRRSTPSSSTLATDAYTSSSTLLPLTSLSTNLACMVEWWWIGEW